jgi:hypothetical protein
MIFCIQVDFQRKSIGHDASLLLASLRMRRSLGKMKLSFPISCLRHDVNNSSLVKGEAAQDLARLAVPPMQTQFPSNAKEKRELRLPVAQRSCCHTHVSRLFARAHM